MEIAIETGSERLLNDCSGEGETDDGSKRAEEVSTGGCYGLVFGGGVGNLFWLVGLEYFN